MAVEYQTKSLFYNSDTNTINTERSSDNDKDFYIKYTASPNMITITGILRLGTQIPLLALDTYIKTQLAPLYATEFAPDVEVDIIKSLYTKLITTPEAEQSLGWRTPPPNVPESEIVAIGKFFENVLPHYPTPYSQDPPAHLINKLPKIWPRFSTKRPVSFMKSLTNPLTVVQADHLYLPVLRYPGLYYNTQQAPANWCSSKFYYVEPESAVLLDLGRTALFASKVDAMKTLHRLVDLTRRVVNYEPPFFQIWWNPESVSRLTRDYFASADEGGEFDHLDQPLCRLARRAGFDTLIFQHEAGRGRPISEILDTRANSYDYLISTQKEEGVPWWPLAKGLATVYFPVVGLLRGEELVDVVRDERTGELTVKLGGLY